ncbi:retrovirus-related Pol polyprotein from transposon TNT 1-94 [Trichonephila clavipes]|nr:retrovirus-related Pol polyprotein from transposon TNT 1-94 [Trichonephila clavipes]
MEIEKCENGIYLSQCDYIDSLLVKHNLENCKSVKTPIVKGEDKNVPSTNEFIDITMYQELIGEFLYLANRTRPDISFVTSYLSQLNHNPEKRHYNLAERMLRYWVGAQKGPNEWEVYTDGSKIGTETGFASGRGSGCFPIDRSVALNPSRGNSVPLGIKKSFRHDQTDGHE